MTRPGLDEMAAWAEADAKARSIHALVWLGGVLFSVAVWAGIIALGMLALSTNTHAKTPEIKPEVQIRLPLEAEAKPDCRVVIGRGIYFARTPDGLIVPMSVLMSIRTKC